jgi:hypothetical protein
LLAFLLQTAAVYQPLVAAGATVTSPMSQASIAGCYNRRLKKRGATVAAPIDNGIELDLRARAGRSTGATVFAVRIVELGDHRAVSAWYAPPFTAPEADRYFHEIGLFCEDEALSAQPDRSMTPASGR